MGLSRSPLIENYVRLDSSFGMQLRFQFAILIRLEGHYFVQEFMTLIAYHGRPTFIAFLVRHVMDVSCHKKNTPRQKAIDCSVCAVKVFSLKSRQALPVIYSMKTAVCLSFSHLNSICLV
jgi:hypothetical protein